MLKALRQQDRFCEAQVVPWMVLLIGASVAVIGWGIYEMEMGEIEEMERTYNPTRQIPLGMPVAQLASMRVGNDMPVDLNAAIVHTGTEARLPPARVNRDTGAGQVLENGFRHAIATVGPAVVSIRATAPAATSGDVLQSIGSGLIVSRRGHILTNYHVVKNADRILVCIYGRQTTYPARVVDYHPSSDLTLLQIDAPEIPDPAPLGDSDQAMPGDMVLAIGSPFGMQQSVTSGIISGTDKTLTIGGTLYEDMLQTDASINRGSSGGPLVNIHGRVIGINTAIYSPSGVFSGTAFAMPINRIRDFLQTHGIQAPLAIARPVVTQLPMSGQTTMGVQVQEVDRIVALHLGLPYIGGALVNRADSRGAGAMSELRRGDVILEIGETNIVCPDDFNNVVAATEPGENTTILVQRDGRLLQLFGTVSQVGIESGSRRRVAR